MVAGRCWSHRCGCASSKRFPSFRSYTGSPPTTKRTSLISSCSFFYNITNEWDGSEYQSSIAAWGIPHSSQTWSAGANSLFWPTLGVAAEASRKQWKEDVAVEFSLSI